MKHLKKYNESITTLESLSNEELEEKLKWLKIEQDEIQEQMVSARKILVNRKEDKEIEYSKSLPKSIFDFNSEQIEWLMEHHHGTTQKHYDIAHKYFGQLSGILQSGFNRHTNQFYFTIKSSSCFNEADDGFKLNDDVVKSIKFLGDSLKKENEYVKFDIMYYYDEGERNDFLHYFSDNDLFYGIGYRVGRGDKYTSIEKLLEDIVDQDLSEQEDRDGNNW